MSFLTPLYIAGALAVGLPILFHMIRRTPSGRVPFSALMFLTPSPPRLTRRSRIENWLLLLLRAAALCLLALAFARPFLRSEIVTPDDPSQGRRIAVLLDTSASMRRGDLWDQAVDRVQELVAESEAADRIAIFAFARELRPVIGFSEWSGLQPDARRDLSKKRLAEFQPGWEGTRLGAALVEAAAMLKEQQVLEGRPVPQSLVLVSDLQTGGDLTALQAYEWPEDLSVRFETVTTSRTTNAGVQLVAQTSFNEKQRRVRVTNSADAVHDRFQLEWETDAAERPEPVSVYVPPGQSRTISVPLADEGVAVQSLVLRGDDHGFDNRVYIAPRVRRTSRVLYYGDDDPQDPDGLRYYLERALTATEQRVVEIEAHDTQTTPLVPGVSEPDLIVVTAPPADEQQTEIRHYLERGGLALCVMESAEDLEAISPLLGRERLEVTEANVEEYVMLTDIDFEHPIFAPFAEVRFSDFTGIHFWNHRSLDLGDDQQALTLARFDDGDPALVELPWGEGTVWLLSAGWHPADSQLARSSKFPPLLNRMLEQADRAIDVPNAFTVGMEFPLPNNSAGELEVTLPDATVVRPAAERETFAETSLPGVYTVRASDRTHALAVNLSPAESRTAPQPVEQLESLGVRVETSAGPAAHVSADLVRQMQNAEMENRQKLWRWLIAAAVLLLLLETWYAARLSRRTAVAETAAGGASQAP